MSCSRQIPAVLLVVVLLSFASACAAEGEDSPSASDPGGRIEEPAPAAETQAGEVAAGVDESEMRGGNATTPDEAEPHEGGPALVPAAPGGEGGGSSPDAPASGLSTSVAQAPPEPTAADLAPDVAEPSPAPAEGDAVPTDPPAVAPMPSADSDPAPVEVALPPGYVPGDPSTHPLAIARLRGLSTPGSDLVVVEELPPGSTYSRAVATYLSEGLTIRGLLTVPNGERPPSGWPVIIFNHGYIPPAQYRTTERYVAYQDAFARAGYITYKSDYRGHGSSEGESGSSRGSPAYTLDVMNALASVARHPEADPNRIGMWGHSMGGLITLKCMVISDRIKAGVIWAGVVASYPDLYNRLGRSGQPSSGSWNRPGRRSWRSELAELFGLPEENPSAWAAVSPNAFLNEISGPLQLHHGTADSSVPVIYSTRLQEQMDAAGRPSETFVYEGDDHNLAGSLSTALARSVAFFDRHVKGEG